MSFDCDLCHFFTCSLSSFNDMSKHLLVLWPLLLLLLWVFVFFWFFFFLLGGGGVVMFFFKKKVVFFCFVFFSLSFFDGKSVMSALCTYYYMCMFV